MKYGPLVHINVSEGSRKPDGDPSTPLGATAQGVATEYGVVVGDGPPQPGAIPTPIKFDRSTISEKLEQLHDRSNCPSRIVMFNKHEALCREIGEYLFTSFLVGDELRRFRSYRADCGSEFLPRIALHLPRSLFYLPWELLRDPGDGRGQYLSTGDTGSLIRYDDVDVDRPHAVYAPSSTPLELLWIRASPEKNPLPDIEMPEIEVPSKTMLKFVPVHPATFDELRRLLHSRTPGGVIFFGHGQLGADSTGQLIFVQRGPGLFAKTWVDDLRPARSVRDAMARSSMRMAWLFACESAWAQTAMLFDQSIVGELLAGTGLGFIVASQTPISFKAASVCLNQMLGSLVNDEGTVDTALSSARQAVRDIVDSPLTYASFDWWVPVLYARTTNLGLLPIQTINVPAAVGPGEPIPDVIPSNIAVGPRAQIGALVGGLLSLLTDTKDSGGI
jgi:hypothetical protein